MLETITPKRIDNGIARNHWLKWKIAMYANGIEIMNILIVRREGITDLKQSNILIFNAFP